MEQFRSDTTEPFVVHRQTSPHYGILDDHTYFPVNHQQLRDLIGKVLTHLDAMNMPDRAHRAARTLLTNEMWQWWNGVYENATTSYKGCIAPVVMDASRTPSDSEETPPSNRWGWASEDDYLHAPLSYLVDLSASGTYNGASPTTRVVFDEKAPVSP